MKGILFGVVLELLFLALCVVLIGHGWNEVKKKKNRRHGLAVMTFGILLAAMSLWMAKLLIEG